MFRLIDTSIGVPMWSVREARLSGERVVLIPTHDLALSGNSTDAITHANDSPLDGKESSVKSIELFAGAGGLALGTANAGLQHKVVIEWDENACSTLRRNHLDGVQHVLNWKIVEGDVHDYDFSQHRHDISFVSGGPPCQPFSIGGKHRGHGDRRNMFPEAVRAIREIRPLAFMFENVRGLLRENFAKYFGYIIHQLRYPTVTLNGDEEWMHHLARLERIHASGEAVGPHYNVLFQCVNAVDYGVPQHRWRVFIIGVRSDLGIEYSFPPATHGQDALHYDMWVSGDYWERHSVPRRRRPTPPSSMNRRIHSLRSSMREMMIQPWKTVRDAINDLPKPAAGVDSSVIPNHYQNPGAKSYPGHTGSPFDEPAKALKAGDHGVPGGENMLRLENGDVRYFSVRECARLQCFPDDWRFEGSWTESMRQLGNAVPVRLAETIANPLVTLLLKVAKISRRV